MLARHKASQTLNLDCMRQVLMTRPREEWKVDVLARYKALEQFSKEDARLQFLRILRSLPYGAQTLLWHTLSHAFWTDGPRRVA